MAESAAKIATETQLDRIEELARIAVRQAKENRQAIERLQRLVERIAGKE